MGRGVILFPFRRPIHRADLVPLGGIPRRASTRIDIARICGECWAPRIRYDRTRRRPATLFHDDHIEREHAAQRERIEVAMARDRSADVECTSMTNVEFAARLNQFGIAAATNARN